jgi:hypothetical protein
MFVTALAALVAFSWAASAAAQQTGTAGQGTPGTEVRGRAGTSRPNRAQLERTLRENFTRRVQIELKLTADDMTKLAAVNRRFDVERRRLVQEERQARIALRNALEGPDSTADQARVGGLLDQMLRITRSRLDLVEQEQRELSAFMTPVQRARYQSMVEWFQRRVDDLMDRGRGGRGGDGRGDGRPGIGRGGATRGGRGGAAPPPTTPPPPGNSPRSATPPPR